MRGIGIVAAVLGLCLACAAAAEPPIGSRLGNRLKKSPEVMNEVKAARHAHSVAKCIVNKRRSGAVRMLASADVPALERAHKSIWAGDLTCFSGFNEGDEMTEGRVFSAPLDIERGMIAEQLLRPLDRQVAALAPLPLRHGSYKRDWFGGSTRNAAIDEMSACMADTQPLGIHALLATAAYTTQEKAAFDVLMLTMGKCLSVGAKLTGNRQSLRAAFADALYQRVINPAASVALTAGTKK